MTRIVLIATAAVAWFGNDGVRFGTGFRGAGIAPRSWPARRPSLRTKPRPRQQFRSLDEEVQDLKKEVLGSQPGLVPPRGRTAVSGQLTGRILHFHGRRRVFCARFRPSSRSTAKMSQTTVYRPGGRCTRAWRCSPLAHGEPEGRDHEVIAVFTGKGPHWRDYRRGATLTLNKGIGAKYVELEITDRVQKQQPEFEIKEC